MAAWYQRNADDPGSDIAPHFPAMSRLVAEHHVRWIIELGVRDGASTSCWVMRAAQASGHVWSVDIVPAQLVPRRNWTFILGDDTDVDVFSQLPDRVDLVFIDTSHAYWHTKLELEMYGAKVRPGGVIVLHDTQNEHPEDHGEPIGYQEPFPVRRAMIEYAETRGYRWTEDEQSWGLGVIYVV